MTPSQRLQKLETERDRFLKASKGEGGVLRISLSFFKDCGEEDWKAAGWEPQEHELFDLGSPLEDRQRAGLISLLGPQGLRTTFSGPTHHFFLRF
jgi:hypothetical protein